MFDRFSRKVSEWLGQPIAFVGSILLVVIWAAFGPYFEWNTTHQLLINTSTTILTFWMVFLLQASQNRDMQALQLKLDELIRVTDARNEIILAEEISREELDHLREQLQSEAR